MKTLAIIPARGGSKGIPHKNLADLCGKPLVTWCIETARHARAVSRIVVSTDDPAIARVSRAARAEVVLRPAEISGDDAPSEAALLHVLESLAADEGYRPDLVVFLQCTAAFTQPEDIDRAVAMLVDEGADSVFTAVPCHCLLWRKDADGAPRGVNHSGRERLLRQQCEPEYRETGGVYVLRAEGFREHKNRFWGKTLLCEVPADHGHDIDTPLDLEIARVVKRRLLERRGAEALPSPVAALFLDFDGVLTDNRVWVDAEGGEAVACNRGDGLGLRLLRERGIPVFVISTEAHPVVARRCGKLGIPCFTAVEDKLACMQAILRDAGLPVEGAVFVGNDVNDRACILAAGCGAVVGDAHPAVIADADLVLESEGGRGAVREIATLILRGMEAAHG